MKQIVNRNRLSVQYPNTLKDVIVLPRTSSGRTVPTFKIKKIRINIIELRYGTRDPTFSNSLGHNIDHLEVFI